MVITIDHHRRTRLLINSRWYIFSLFLVADLEDEGRNAIDGPASPSQESIDPSAFLLGKTAFNLLVGKMS